MFLPIKKQLLALIKTEMRENLLWLEKVDKIDFGKRLQNFEILNTGSEKLTNRWEDGERMGCMLRLLQGMDGRRTNIAMNEKDRINKIGQSTHDSSRARANVTAIRHCEA